MIGEIKSYCEAPKWLRVPKWIRIVCFQLGLDCEIDIDSHFLRETVWFKVVGEEEALNKFKDYFYEAMNKYNHKGG